jgi:hypothetical protein
MYHHNEKMLLILLVHVIVGNKKYSMLERILDGILEMLYHDNQTE